MPKDVGDATASLLIALAFTVPVGTDVRKAFGAELKAFKDAAYAAGWNDAIAAVEAGKDALYKEVQ